MNVHLKQFSQLQVLEWHKILTLRASVFVVEQNCVYQDPDLLDFEALHLWFEDDLGYFAYLRMIPPNSEYKYWKIGRVLVKPNRRFQGMGNALMKRALLHLGSSTTIHISAQCYLMKFYENLGFTAEGDTYVEDGIPHVFMTRNGVD
jgi:ElaA protein